MVSIKLVNYVFVVLNDLDRELDEYKRLGDSKKEESK